MSIKNDLSKERRFSMFLEKNIFPRLVSHRIYAERVTNTTLDHRGVDATINGALVDIKAHELKEESPRRYSFERETRNWCGNGYSSVVDGWLVNRKKITEKYLLCYYKQNENKQITSVQLMLVDREKIINAMRENGIDVTLPTEDLRRSASHAMAQPNGSVKYFFSGVKDMSLTHSHQLPEEPLNVIVQYDTIRKLCDWSVVMDMEVPVEW